VVAAIDTIWDVVDLYNDARDCFGDSDSMACYMAAGSAVALALPLLEGPSNNVARRAAKAADVGDAAKYADEVAEGLTKTSPTGLKVTVDEAGNPVRWEYKVSAKGQRGTGYLDVEVGAGMHRGHVMAVNEGAGINAIDDGPLNIIEQSPQVNLSNVKRFENWRVKNAQGARVTVDRLPNGYIRTRMPSKGIDVIYNPVSTKRFPKDWYLRGGIHH